MKKGLKYLVDSDGNRLAVIVPMGIWNNMNSGYDRSLKKVSILTGIRDGLEEVKKTGMSGRKLQTLKDFLKEM